MIAAVVRVSLTFGELTGIVLFAAAAGFLAGLVVCAVAAARWGDHPEVDR